MKVTFLSHQIELEDQWDSLEPYKYCYLDIKDNDVKKIFILSCEDPTRVSELDLESRTSQILDNPDLSNYHKTRLLKDMVHHLFIGDTPMTMDYKPFLKLIMLTLRKDTKYPYEIQ